MEIAPWASFLTIVLTTVLFLLAICRHHSRKYNPPPGPTPFPVIGSLNLVGPLLHRSLQELSAQYGPFMSIRLGSHTFVIGSSVEAAKFFLKTNDMVFIDRPRTAAGKYTLYNHSDILSSPYGAYWRQARKLCQATLFSESQLKSQEYIRREEMRATLNKVLIASSSGHVVRLKDHLYLQSLNVICRLVLGKKYVGDDSVTSLEEFMWMMDELLVLNGAVVLGDVIPWLSFLDLQGYIGRMKKLNKMFDLFLEHMLHQHNERRQGEGKNFVPKDMVDLLQECAEDPNLEVPIKRDGVKALVLVRVTVFGMLHFI
ncbi:hypothetical protein EJB05_27812, partial [Eragrostis curvula]